MTGEDKDTHRVAIELLDPPPPEVAVGAAIALKVRVACAAGCDLRGLPIRVTAADGTVATSALAAGADGVGDSSELALKAPLRVGEHAWTIACLPHEAEGVRHEHASLDIPIRAIAHETSLAVWDVPSPVVAGARFAIKVGAKSAAGCDLKGQAIVVRDDAGAVVAGGRLGGTPWSGTGALFWTTIELLAPSVPGLFSRLVTFEAPELALAHSGTASRFSTAVVPPPEHRLTVKVIEKATQAPIESAEIRLGPYRAATNAAGLAEVRLPKGDYDLFVWKASHDTPMTPVHIEADATVEVEATKVEEDPYAPWTM